MHALKVLYYIVLGLLVGSGLAFVIGTFVGCSRHHEEEAPIGLADVQAERDRRVAAFHEEQVERCDRITFVAMMDAYGKEMDLERYESPKGKWNRDVEPCYPEESRSECSLDGYLSVLHALVGDQDRAIQLRSYLQEKNWLCGEGDEGSTQILPLRLIISQMADREGAGKLAGSSEDALPDVLSGFRGHLLANYIWLHRKVYISPDFMQSLAAKLTQETPESPYLAALAGYRQRAVELLADFKDCSRFWGSCDDDVYYAMTVAVLEGK